MAMTRSTERILTTHVGSLPRPRALLDLMKAALAGHSIECAAGPEAVIFVSNHRAEIAHLLDVA